MIKLKNKTMTILIALILMLTMAVPFVALPTANAQGTMTTYAFISAMPNPVGVNQEVLIYLGLPLQVSNPKVGWEGLTVTVTRPDGVTETLGPITTDQTGGTGKRYTPTMAGNYTLQTHFPEQVLDLDIVVWGAPSAWVKAGTVMEASDSEKLTLVVQEEPIQSYPGVPLPTEYWTRPIDAQFYEWYTVAGNWLMCPYNLHAPYNDAPETPHILWTKPLAIGGLIGGDYGSHSYEHGASYQFKFANPVIINGILYYNRFQRYGEGGIQAQGIIAADLRTGEELWFRNNTRLSHGQIVDWDGFNLHGAYPYLWEVVGSTWNAYDAFTGEWVYTMKNVPAGLTMYGPSGEILRCVVNQKQGWMALWNSTKVVSTEGMTDTEIMAEIPRLTIQWANSSWGSWNPFARMIDASSPRAYSWNVSIPTDLVGIPQAFLEDRIIGTNHVGQLGGITPDIIHMWGLSLKPGQEGTLLFKTSWTPPSGNLTIGSPGGPTVAAAQSYMVVSAEDGIFILAAKETRQYYGFSLDTGKQLWGPTTPMEPALNIYSITYGKSYCSTVYDGKLISPGQGGVVNAYDIKTGEHLWTYEAYDNYNEILWGVDWPIVITFVTDGKIYLGHLEHSAVQPLPRDAPFICLNATTGKEIFRVDGLIRLGAYGAENSIIGDNIIVTHNTYDNRLIAMGKGPSATTVSASPKVSVHGSSILVEGMVTDISPGTEDYALRARFPSGVPAVADDSMGEWMKYVYAQFPRPTNATGVPVTLSVVDANGNYREIGAVTSDADGFFSLNWKPDIDGKYTVYASFAGSESYWPSQSTTAFAVEPAAPTPTPSPVPIQSVADQYFVPAIAGIFVAIAIVGVVMLLAVRKRPTVA